MRSLACDIVKYCLLVQSLNWRAIHWRQLRTLDQEPQHKRNLSDLCWQGEYAVKDHLLVLRYHYARKAQAQIEEAGDEQPDAQKAGNKTGPVDKDCQGDEPKPPECF